MAKAYDDAPAIPRANAYPWDRWQDGRWWKIVGGEDFVLNAELEDPIKPMRDQLYTRATHIGRKVSTRRREDTLWFRFQGPDETEEHFKEALRETVTDPNSEVPGSPVT
jgi:hypothetical protein